jgi:hypothetical protein
MGDDKRALNTEASLRNGTSRPRVGVGVLLVDQRVAHCQRSENFLPKLGVEASL